MYAQGFTLFGVKFWGEPKKYYWYKADSTDSDLDKHPLARWVDTKYQNKSPGNGWSKTYPTLPTSELDCNDGNNLVWRLGTFWIDLDGDGYSNEQATICYGSFIPIGYAQNTNGSDCNNLDALKWDEVTVFKDFDKDGFDGGVETLCIGNTLPDGYSYVSNGADCDDSLILFLDNDGDGFGVNDTVACGVSDRTDCDDADAMIHVAQPYYLDANGDGFGDSQETFLFCSRTPPSGYTSNPQVLPDLTLSTLNRPMIPDYWIFNIENLFYDKKKFYDPLVGTLNSKIIALHPRGFMYSGSPSHYHQYLRGDTVNYRPNGYNSIPTTNEQAGYGAAWTQSCFPSTVTLADQCDAGVFVMTSPTKNCTDFLSQMTWMVSKGVHPLGFYCDQEYQSRDWADCANCGNGDAVAADGTYWFDCVDEAYPSLPYVIDNQFNPRGRIISGSYPSKIRNTIGYNSQRFYYAPSKGTPNLSSTMTATQIVDSFDYGIEVILPQIIQACSRSAYLTSLYPEDIDPRGGRLATSGTWSNSYFIIKSYIASMYEPLLKGVVFGRFDLLDVKATSTNSLYATMEMAQPFFHYNGTLYDVSSEGVDAIGVVNANHGYILLVNRTATGKDVSEISIDGFITPVTEIKAQVAQSLTDTNPIVRTTQRIEPYSVNLISF